MKVLLHADLPSASGAGGVQTYLGALIKALGQLADGDEEYLVLGPPPADAAWLAPLLGPNQRLLRLPAGPQPLSVRMVSAPARSLRRLLRPALASPRWRGGLIRVLRRHAHTAGIAVSGGAFEATGAAVVHFPYQHFVRTQLASVFNPHDLQHLHLPEFFTPDAFAHRELTYACACRHATLVAVATGWVASDVVARYGLPARNVHVVPWGAATAAGDLPSAAQVRDAARRFAGDEPFFLYPAVAWPHKNHERLIAALALLRRSGHSARLVLSGGPASMHAPLHDACRRHDVAAAVNIAGHISGADLRALYRAARAVIVPTLFEAASGPVAEAWLEGTPAACSDIPPLRSQADGAVLFFDPFSPASIAAAAARLLDDETLRRSLVAAGFERIARLTWRETALGYRALYREAAARRPRPR